MEKCGSVTLGCTGLLLFSEAQSCCCACILSSILTFTSQFKAPTLAPALMASFSAAGRRKERARPCLKDTSRRPTPHFHLPPFGWNRDTWSHATSAKAVRCIYSAWSGCQAKVWHYVIMLLREKDIIYVGGEVIFRLSHMPSANALSYVCPSQKPPDHVKPIASFPLTTPSLGPL